MTLINRTMSLYFSPLLKELEIGKKHPGHSQQKTFEKLLSAGKDTFFGKEHSFSSIHSTSDYQKQVPIRKYDDFQPYIERLREGEDYILWNQKVKWFAKSSGTSSGKSKFIPITPDNLHRCHYRGFQLMMASYIDTYPSSRLYQGKALTLGGSVSPDNMRINGTFNGDLSAILLLNSPRIVETLRVPERKIALLGDFEKKVEIIARECTKWDVTNFSGVPSWNMILIEKMLEYNGKKYLTDIWPNVELFMHGGISFDPYREQYKRLIPKSDMHYYENYNASEGYFAFQDDYSIGAMTIAMGCGIFYEFVPLNILDRVLAGDEHPGDVCTLEDVSEGVKYAMVISTNSGLWRYLIGDCVEFVSLRPHRMIITGRTQLFINAFGEELMIGNAEKALADACRECDVVVNDYTVAPIFMNSGATNVLSGTGAHEWVVEFRDELDPEVIEHFADTLDRCLCSHNSDYEAKRTNNATMSRLVLTPVPKGTFYRWMEKRGKIGGQNKVPRLSGRRQYVEELTTHHTSESRVLAHE